MFCPNCGVEDIKASQFCRACGAELMVVRNAIEQRADTNPIAARTAREEIGRALADKIRQSESAADLKLIIHEMLPIAERFLETPEERRRGSERVELERLIRVRIGAFLTAAGFFEALIFLVAGLATRNTDWNFLMIPGFIAFLVGIGILVHARFLPVLPGTRKTDQAPALDEETLGHMLLQSRNKELGPAEPEGMPSVTEGTTRQL